MSYGEIPVAVGAGFLSFLAPCVLPLVPGYLSAVSAVEADRLGEAGSSARVVRASVPFVLGFTLVFVALGAGAAAVGGSILRNQFLLEQVAGFVLIVFGLVFMGLLPWPERLLGAGLLQEARSRGSRVLLGGAFAAGVLAVGFGAYQWRRRRKAPAAAPAGPGMDAGDSARLEADLERYDL